jgi:hypothetical protein
MELLMVSSVLEEDLTAEAEHPIILSPIRDKVVLPDMRFAEENSCTENFPILFLPVKLDGDIKLSAKLVLEHLAQMAGLLIVSEIKINAVL